VGAHEQRVQASLQVTAPRQPRDLLLELVLSPSQPADFVAQFVAIADCAFASSSIARNCASK